MFHCLFFKEFSTLVLKVLLLLYTFAIDCEGVFVSFGGFCSISNGLYWVLPHLTSFLGTCMGFTVFLHWFGYSNGFSWILLGHIWFLGTCIGFTGFTLVWVRFQWISLGFGLVLLVFSWSHLVSRDLHRFYWFLHWFGCVSNGFYWVSIWFCWVLLGLTWFLGTCIGFTGFYVGSGTFPMDLIGF